MLNRKILIPGSPISSINKDSPVTGFWLCQLVGSDISCEFAPIETIHKDYYHRFLHTDD